MSRTAVVVVPLLVLLVGTGGLGARMLLADPDEADASAGPARCWDGSTSDDGVEGCSRPRGLDGLAWVFPSVDLDDRACTGVEEGRIARWTCRARAGGEPVTLTYAAVPDARKAVRRLDRTYADGDRAPARAEDGSVNRWVWRLSEPDESGRWLLTSAYREHPYSVRVAAPSARARDLALRELVEHRDPAEVRGVPE
ncbi:hypothetical protein [Nocardioides marmotae]|uniref:hypothetical protein n=1 Tax=Nocardioides marmotae TaxID=2663857 RepID=UPI0012B57935|nr:hypothetical protein [Nocardioides marmotae]MBC9732320.1 hypothetical protein [Nocardioides marmotae]MTB83440.1 hypothetical protein [Nocardioides marmotae]